LVPHRADCFASISDCRPWRRCVNGHTAAGRV